MTTSSLSSPTALRDSTHAPLGCPRCGGVVDIRTRFVEVRASAIRMYCSEECQLRDGADEPAEVSAPPRRRRGAKVLVAASIVGGGLAAFGAWTADDEVKRESVEAVGPLAVPMGPPPPPPEYALTEHGPSWPPTEDDRIEMLASDAWIHPLRGPERRMPIRASRAFGASRPGHRPPECNAGHCGVDLGGHRWGEPVMAVKDGVVERIERDPNGNGGRYVWIAHQDDSVFSHYFHLAAIPPELRLGDRVRRGQTIGLLGGSGVNHSGPHLHFTVAVKLPGDTSRRYIDPEPLIALWPLEVPVACDTGTAVTTNQPPGRVIGSQRGYSRPPRRIASRRSREASSAPEASGADAGEAAAGGATAGGAGEGAEPEGDVRPISSLPGARGGGDEEGRELGTLPGFAP